MSDKPAQHPGFLHADDIGYGPEGGKNMTLAIDRIAKRGTVTDARGNPVEEPVLYFRDHDKGLVLGANCNRRLLVLHHGRKSADWIGKPVTLTVRFLDCFGEKDVPAIRITPPDGTPLPFGLRKWYGREKPIHVKIITKQ